VTLHELGSIAAIDEFRFDRIAASRRYATQTNYRFRSLKTTLLRDCSTGAILDVYCATIEPLIQNQLTGIAMKHQSVSTITADKGYGWADLSTILWGHHARLITKYRKFDSLHTAHNARLNDEVYYRRSVVETTFRMLKQCYVDNYAPAVGIVSTAN
jgi:transposase